MPTFVRYNLESGEIFSLFKTSSDEFVPLPNSEEEGIIQVPEDELPEDLTPSTPGMEMVRGRVTDGKLQQLHRQPAFPVQLEITADLEDRSGGGTLAAPADGETAITIRARVTGTAESKNESPAMVRFRTTRGTLSQRFVETQDGVAEVQLRAITETTEAVVSASTEGSSTASLVIEFIPVEEYESSAPKDETP